MSPTAAPDALSSVMTVRPHRAAIARAVQQAGEDGRPRTAASPQGVVSEIDLVRLASGS